MSMPVMTLNELEQYLKNHEAKIDYYVEYTEKDCDAGEQSDGIEDEYFEGVPDQLRHSFKRCYGGIAVKHSYDHFWFMFRLDYSFEENDLATLDVSMSDCSFDEFYEIDGIIVVDEDGEQADEHELLSVLGHDSFTHDADKVKDLLGFDELDDEYEEYRRYSDDTIILKGSHQSPIKFNGKKIANVSNRYEEDEHRWLEIRLYEVTNGNFIGEKSNHSIIYGERTCRRVECLSTVAQIKNFFGQSKLADRLLSEAGIE